MARRVADLLRRATLLTLVAAVWVAAPAGAADDVKLRTKRIVVVPDTPAAGRLVRAHMEVVRADNGAPVRVGKVTCTARVGRVELTVLARGFRSAYVYAGKRRTAIAAASCTWRLPKSARGRNIEGSIRVDALGSLARRYFARPII